MLPISQLSSCAGTAPFPGKTGIIFLNMPKVYFQKLIMAVKHRLTKDARDKREKSKAHGSGGLGKGMLLTSAGSG